MKPESHQQSRLVTHGPFQLDFERRACILPDGNLIPLTPREMQILSRLSESFRKTKEIAGSIANEVFWEAFEKTDTDPTTLLSENSITVVVSDLRKKFGKKYRDFIETKPGFGYRLKPQ